MSNPNAKIPEKDLYFVAVKLFLVRDNKLLITHDIYGSWDLPGGRIRRDEFNKPLAAVIKRKVLEELGPAVQYELGAPKVFFRVQRNEYDLGGQPVRIFAVGYNAKLVSGKIRLGDHHDQMEWVDIKSFKPEEYFADGWLSGVKEYLAEQKSI